MPPARWLRFTHTHSVRVCSGVTDGTVITVTVLDTVVGRWQQMKQQAEQAKQQAMQFYRIGCGGGGNVDGQYYMAWHSSATIMKALETNDQNADAWFRLGFEGSGSVGGQQYTEQQCFIRALEINNQHPMAWHRLGLEGGGSVAAGAGSSTPSSSCSATPNTTNSELRRYSTQHITDAEFSTLHVNSSSTT